MSNENINDLQTSSEEKPTQTLTNQDPYATIMRGENSQLTEEDLSALKQAASSVNLPADALAKWVSLEENRLQQAADKKSENTRLQQAQWAAQTRESLGVNWQEEVSQAVRAADVFGGPELRQLLEETGLGNHPAIVRTFAEVAKRMREDISLGASTAAPADKTFTQALYGTN